MEAFDPATRVSLFIQNGLHISYALLQRELDAFLSREQANAKLNSTIHSLTTMCWDK